MRFVFGLIAVLVAAAVAGWLVMPESASVEDLVSWRPGGGGDDAAVNLKDDARVPSAAGEPRVVQAGGEGEGATGVPELRPILVDQVPFETTCGLFLTPPGSRDVVFVMPQAEEGRSDTVAAINIEGALVLLRRVEADGEPFGPGAYPRQLFRTEDGSLSVVAKVSGTGSGEATTTLEDGELTVMMSGRATLKMPVAGRAGC